MNKKVSILQIARLLIQLLFFILLPGLFINVFAGIKQIYLSIITNSFSLADNLPQLIEVIAVIPVTMILGRFFCGWMCAFGTLGDVVYHISSKIFKMKFRMNEKLDKALKYLKYGILALLIVVVWTFGIKAFSGANPWDAFGVLATVGKTPDISYAFTEFTIGTLLLLAIIAASFFIERFFCRYLCPLGAVFAILSRLKLIKVHKPSQKCGSCRICTNSCAMGIPLYREEKINSGECINCFKCVSACPRKNAVANIGTEDIRTGIAAAAAIGCMTSAYYTENFALAAAGLGGNPAISANFEASAAAGESKLYTDGTYEGSGNGFRGAVTTVSVTVKNDTITDVEVVSHGDDRPYFNRASQSVISGILSSQSTDVDVVSGATYSSVGIMDAVADALDKAKLSNASAPVEKTIVSDAGVSASNAVDEKVPASGAKENVEGKITEADPSQSENSGNAVNESITTKQADSTYKDGTYTCSARGFRRGTTTVSVVVKNDTITDVEVVSNGDDRPYFNRAISVIDDMLQSQSTDVDAVSGATYSSLGIINAVKAALDQAKV